MKHDWEPDPEFGTKPMHMMDPAIKKRICKNCGAKQGYYYEYRWMRVSRRYWSPKVGRCKGAKK